MAAKSEMSLFGLDLSALGRFLKQGWEEALRYPQLAWLSPAIPVRLLLLNGGASIGEGASGRELPAQTEAQVLALELPGEVVLERRVKIPALSSTEIEQALELEVAAVSPFSPEDRVWGWAWSGPQEVRLALASLTHVRGHLEREAPRLRGKAPEVWFDAQEPVVLRGFAEPYREALQQKSRRRILMLLAGVAGLVVLLAASPVLQERHQTFEAQASLAATEKEAAPVIAQRDELGKINSRMGRIESTMQLRPDALRILEKLTQALPDDTVLTRLDISPAGTVSIQGETANAAKVQEILGNVEGFSEVRPLGASNRNRSNDKEVFQIEWVYKPVEPLPVFDTKALAPVQALPKPAEATESQPLPSAPHLESPPGSPSSTPKGASQEQPVVPPSAKEVRS